MTVKERVIKAVQDLPDDSSIDEVMETLYLLMKVEHGLQQADNGLFIPHNEVIERISVA